MAERPRAAIMQPYFFPYPGYFALLAKSDIFVVLDLTQYTPKRWMNRNRLLRPDGTWCWVTAAVQRAPRATQSKDIVLVDKESTERLLRSQLRHFRSTAPYWATVDDLVATAFSETNTDFLVDLNVSGIHQVAKHLSLGTTISVASRLDLDLRSVAGPGDWAPVICEQIGARSYLNPEGGRVLFDTKRFERAGIELSFLEHRPVVYQQPTSSFVPDLSILDALLWVKPEDLRSMLLALPEQNGSLPTTGR
jgi:hypothetical protein